MRFRKNALQHLNIIRRIEVTRKSENEKSEKLFIALLTSVVAFTFVVLPLNIAHASEVEVVNPLAKYEFLDASNPGKDSMGNYNLVLRDADGVAAGTGVVSASEGVATFNGTAGLHASENGNDISEVLKSFTLAFDIQASTAHGGWATPVGFGWNDWNPTKWGMFQFSGGSNLLRYSTGPNIDGTTNAFWAAEIGNVKTDGFQSVLLIAEPGKKIEVYLDGVLKYSHDLPQDFTFSDSQMRFALGGVSCWGNIYCPFIGSLKNVEIYDFALNETQIAQYNETGKVYRALDVIVSESITDLSSVVRVPAGASHAQILGLAPESSNVEVKMSNDSVKTANVTWNGVEEKDGSLYLTGEIAGLVNPNGVKAYAKITVVENAKVLLPIALYEFKDATNPGKDSMGNWDLAVVTKKDDEGNYLDGSVRVENGVAYFDGSAGLLADSEDNDISEALKSFTLTFEVLQTQTPGGWSEPIGFGWDDWTPKAKWCTFELSGGSSDLRFTTASARDESSGNSNVDGNGTQWWGTVVGNIATRQTVVLSVDLEGNIVVYVDGVKKYSYATPAGYSLTDGNMRFAIGGNGVWGAFKNEFVGEISNVAIYDFAVNDSQAKELSVTHELKAGVTTTAPYVAEINTTPVFAGEATSAELTTLMSEEEMLAALNSANVKAMLSDESTLDLPVVWTEVVNEAGVYTAHGYAVCEGVLTAVNRVEVSHVLTVTDVLVAIEVATNPSKMTYVVGEELDLAGLVVNKVMGSGAESQVTVTADMVSGFDSSKAGTTTITISYEGKMVTIDLTVEAAEEPTPTPDPEPTPTPDPEPTPTPTPGPNDKPDQNSGCGGSVLASIFGLLALAGATIVLRKKREE